MSLSNHTIFVKRFFSRQIELVV